MCNNNNEKIMDNNNNVNEMDNTNNANEMDNHNNVNEMDNNNNEKIMDNNNNEKEMDNNNNEKEMDYHNNIDNNNVKEMDYHNNIDNNNEKEMGKGFIINVNNKKFLNGMIVNCVHKSITLSKEDEEKQIFSKLYTVINKDNKDTAYFIKSILKGKKVEMFDEPLDKISQDLQKKKKIDDEIILDFERRYINLTEFK